MALPQLLPWHDPLDIGANIAARGDSHWVFLYSATQTSYSGRYSFIACHMTEKITGNEVGTLATRLSDNRPCFDNAWFGVLGYGLKNSMESLTVDIPNWLQPPPLCMMQFSTILVFDHVERQIQVWGEHDISSLFNRPASPAVVYPFGVHGLASNMTKSDYLKKVGDILVRINAGELYQANLTRKFMGSFASAPDPYAIFRSLCTVSPAPYSAYLRMDDLYVASSSPEQFLKIDTNGTILTRPIKGTAARSTDPIQDEIARQHLLNSSKDRAENLMIVDLMRNDLSKSCLLGSLEVSGLFTITTHANIHHMSSTISGKKRADCSTLESIMYCFPPGSMTGAPKIRAMELCSQLETLERGIYSGAIGWLGGDGTCELSVVIRTLLIQNNRFEFQVGGGIVADSTPEAEFVETIVKSTGILKTLGISSTELEAL